MIQQAVFQIVETASRIGENTSKINETLKATIKETQDIAPVFVDTKTAKILHKMGDQTNPQLKLNLLDLPARRYKMNDVDITLEQSAFLDKDNNALMYNTERGVDECRIQKVVDNMTTTKTSKISLNTFDDK